MTKRKNNTALVLLGVCLFATTPLVAQHRELRGRILDRETGQVLPGATIRTTQGRGTISDPQGRYALPIDRGDTLLVSYVGFAPESIPAARLGRHADILLTPGIELQTLTVTASIASARSAKAVGSKVDKLNVGKLMEQGLATSLSDAIDGRVGGVQLYQSNGKVGMPLRFNMRSGATMSMHRDPIIYVDGIRYTNTNISDINSAQDALSALNDLPLEDIASIDIIKGPAAAASYGAEAANGVVVITTKRQSYRAGADQVQQRKTDVNLKYTHGLSTLARPYQQFVNNDALNSFFQTGQESRLYASLGKTFAHSNKLYFSVNQANVSGIVPGNSDRRTTLRAAFDLREQRLGLSVTAGYTNGLISLPQTAQGRYDAIWNLMINQKPWPYIEQESWRAQSWTYANDRFLGSARLSYLLPLGVKLETLFGLDVNHVLGTYLLPYGYPIGSNSEGAKNVSNRRNASYNWDFKLGKQFVLTPNWHLTTSLLSQLASRYYEVYSISTSRFGGDVDNIAAARERSVREPNFEQRTWGLYAEAFLNYRNKLFFNLGLRRDATNLIGSNVASILYPSLSVAYNTGGLKLRTAYGESGRLPNPTDAHTTYVLADNSAYGPTVRPQNMGNPDVRPERMRELELGADWQHRAHQLSLTAYGQHTTDAIIYEELLASDGWQGNKPRNVGSIRGWGLELSYNARLWEAKDSGHSLDVFATVNYQGNQVLDSGGKDIVNIPNIIREGLPVYAFYYKKVDGPAYQKDGKYDLKAGARESTDYFYLGKPFADFNGGFGLDFRLMKYFALGVKFNYALGASVYNQTLYNVAGLGDNLKKRQEQLSRLEASTVGTPEYTAIAEELARSARLRANYIEPADFLRLSSLSLSYDASSWVRRLTSKYIRGAKVTLAAQNLWLLTNYSGAEPQVESNSGAGQQRGIGNLSRDITNAPTPRTFVGTIAINF